LKLRHGGAPPATVPEVVVSPEKTTETSRRPPPGFREKLELLSLKPREERCFFFVIVCVFV